MMARKTEPAIVGLDLSLTATGIAFIDGTTATVKDSKITGAKRLVDLYHQVSSACLKADLVVIEDLPTHAKSAGLTGKAHGVVEMALTQAGVPFIKIPPANLKKAATGIGNCDKDAMRDWVPRDVRGGLADDNQVDAYWLRQCGLELLGRDQQLECPSALDKYRLDPIVMAMQEVRT